MERGCSVNVEYVYIGKGQVSATGMMLPLLATNLRAYTEPLAPYRPHEIDCPLFCLSVDLPDIK